MFAAVVLLCAFTRDVSAQIYETVGIRAQGMGGAFVAVADDATATWWNPAGLAGGPYFSSIIESGTAQDPRSATDAGGLATPSWRSSTRGFAVAYPALGLSYYRLRVSEIRPSDSTGGASPGREDQGRAPVLLSSFVLQQFGATVGQSLGDHLVVGSTLKLVRGSVAAVSGTAADASLDRASELEDGTETHVDIDLGAIASFGRIRVGVAVKNMRQPSFTSSAARVDLRRQARVGMAATTGGQAKTAASVTFAADADLTRTATARGDVRHIAAGVEAWMVGRQLGLRGGVSANTVGDARPAAGAGISLAMRSGTYFDGEATFGSDHTRRGWGLGLRVTF